MLKYARWRLLDAVKRSRRDDPLDEEAEPAPCAVLEDVLPALETAEFLAALTLTQRNVLACLLAGLTWREAGSALGCTSANIAYHVRQIKGRYLQRHETSLADRAQAAI